MAGEAQILCKGCGANLPDAEPDETSEVAPCPGCGGTGRRVDVKVTVPRLLSNAASGSLGLGTTGRTTEVFNTEYETSHERVARFTEWLMADAAGLEWDEVLDTSEIAQALLKEMRSADRRRLSGILWRGRRFEASEEQPSTKRLGPPPPDKVEVGRFNAGHEVVLYCCRSWEALPDEVPPTPEKPVLWVQRFDITDSSIHLVRLDVELRDSCPLLHELLFVAERNAKQEENYRPTHFVRHLCAVGDVDAIEYPNVAGGFKEDDTALNVVVFGSAIERVTGQSVGVPRPYPKGP